MCHDGPSKDQTTDLCALATYIYTFLTHGLGFDTKSEQISFVFKSTARIPPYTVYVAGNFWRSVPDAKQSSWQHVRSH